MKLSQLKKDVEHDIENIKIWISEIDDKIHHNNYNDIEIHQKRLWKELLHVREVELMDLTKITEL